MKYMVSKYGKFHYFNNDDIGNRIANGEFHDEHLRPFIDALQPGDTMVDVGANFGFLTVYAAKRGINVVAYEPAEALMELLRQNVKENDVEKHIIDYFQIPLMSKVQWLRVNPAWGHAKDPHGIPDWEVLPNTGGFSLVPLNPEDWVNVDPQHRFMSSTLDCFIFEKVKLIKIDAQGADYQVILGAVQTIAKHRPTICFEFEPQDGDMNACGDKLTYFLELFDHYHYEVRRINQGMTASDYVAEPL